MKSQDVIQIALSYVGKTEIPGNMGFSDKVFQKKMEEVGWEKTLAWCSYFAELVYKEASCDAVLKKLLGKLFSGSATTTYKNFELDGTWKVGPLPKPGSLAIYRHGTGWQGHAAICVGPGNGETFPTVEGNTNDQGGREGYIVARKNRYIKKAFTPTGLNLVGHIYLCES